MRSRKKAPDSMRLFVGRLYGNCRKYNIHEETMNDAILVLGMHRSGTSAVTGALSLLGSTLPQSLMPANLNNVRGYFESARVMQLNDAILCEAGSSWDDWRRLDLTEHSAAFQSSAKSLVDEEFGQTSLLILKDPRICRFVPFWVSVIVESGYAPRAVLPFRSPLEVAHSLSARDGFPIGKGLALWLRHVLDAERESRNIDRIFVSMDNFLADWRECAARIGYQFAIEWPSFNEIAAGEVDEFLSLDLKHQKAPNLKDAVSNWVRLAYEALLTLERDARSTMAMSVLDQIAESFEESCVLFGPIQFLTPGKVRQRDDGISAPTAESNPRSGASEQNRAIAVNASGQEPETAFEDDLNALRVESRKIRESLQQLQGSTLSIRRGPGGNKKSKTLRA